MLVNITHDTKREHARLLVAGIVFLAMVASLIGLSIAIYQKTFDDVAMITVKADRAGLQLAKFGDVRVNGVLVGQVRSVGQDGEEASIEVAVEPDAVKEIPANVNVEILPTTLFGQKYIAFVDPEDPSEESLEDGDVIASDRVETNVELDRILSQLFPLLRAVEPADLNKTLNALSTALEGRGDQLGDTMVELEDYLEAIQPHLPTLRQDLIKLASVADTYDLAAPDLIAVLRNLTVTSRTVIEKRRDLDVFFSDVGGLADTSTRLLSENEQNLIRVGEVTEPFLKLLAVYSPEFPCLLKGAAHYAPLLSKTFEGNEVKQFIEFGTNQYRNYDQRDLPRYGEVGHGPWCSGLPNPPVPIGPVNLDEGSDISANSNVPGSQDGRVASDAQRAVPSWAAGPGMSSGYAGSAADQALLNALLAAESGRAVDTYGALGSLLYGPVVRGGETS